MRRGRSVAQFAGVSVERTRRLRREDPAAKLDSAALARARDTTFTNNSRVRVYLEPDCCGSIAISSVSTFIDLSRAVLTLANYFHDKGRN
jgi:hypothetical protein